MSFFVLLVFSNSLTVSFFNEYAEWLIKLMGLESDSDDATIIMVSASLQQPDDEPGISQPSTSHFYPRSEAANAVMAVQETSER